MASKLTTFLTQLLFLLLFTGLALASGCSAPPCGRVINNTRWTARWADLTPGNNRCHVYNWNGGKGSVGWSDKVVDCTQHTLSAHSSKGGFTHDRIDVDGITYADRRWRIIWEKGQSYDFAQGVWAKIRSGETVTCTENVQVPECRVKCTTDLDPIVDSCTGD